MTRCASIIKPMDKPKTMFAIYLMEDEDGTVTVQSDHYGPGMNSYNLGIGFLMQLAECQMDDPGKVKVEPLAYLPRAQ